MSDLEGKRILVVEDNRFNSELVIYLLQSLGCLCELATSGAVAIECFSRQDFDLILMDCQMDEIDGLTATRAIRKIEADRRDQAAKRDTTRSDSADLRSVPIIALTASANNEERRACKAAGMNQFISKPFRVKLLEQTIRLWLLNRSHAAAVVDEDDDLERVEPEPEPEPRLDPSQKQWHVVMHEWLNLMQPIIAYADLLQSDAQLDEGQRRKVLEIYQSALTLQNSMVRQSKNVSAYTKPSDQAEPTDSGAASESQDERQRKGAISMTDNNCANAKAASDCPVGSISADSET
tara:strand:+ start:597 stop:1475 length:879 start_codon:yes stop_codon:yes gene_type:complete